MRTHVSKNIFAIFSFADRKRTAKKALFIPLKYQTLIINSFLKLKAFKRFDKSLFQYFFFVVCLGIFYLILW